MTDIINLEDLPFPMFETTEEEKEELHRVIRVMQIGGTDSYFICNTLRDRFNNLRTKINYALEGNGTLNDYLDSKIGGEYYSSRVCDELLLSLRVIWVNKLLAYKGE